MNLRRRGVRAVLGLALAAVALYAVGSLGASIGSHERAAVAEYQYPSIDMNAAPDPVAVGQPTTITWSTTNLDSCEAQGDWSGQKPLQGSESVLVWGWDRAFFDLHCTGIWGEDYDGVYVPAVLPFTARAATDQQQPWFDGLADHAGIAQTFTVGASGWLTDVLLSGTGTSPTDRVSITKVTPGGVPDSAHVLWSAPVTGQATAGNLHLARPLLVFTGQHLALTLTGEDVYQGFSCDAPHPYTRGDMYVQDEACGPWSQQEGCDTVFRTYVLLRLKQGP